MRTARSPKVARQLEPFDVATLADDDDLADRALDGELLAGSAERVTIVGSRLTDVRLAGTCLAELRLRDVVVERCELAGVDLQEARFDRCRFVDCRLSGSVLAAARLRHVRFEGCRMDGISFRMAAMEATQFHDCDLSHADLYEARAPECQFLGCRLDGAVLTRAELVGSELHGSRLAGLVDVLALRGVRVDPLQVTELAHAVLAAQGIEVTEEPTAG